MMLLADNGGPSEKAIEAAWRKFDESAKSMAPKFVLEAAHDPALGLDRSVCLRGVVEALRGRTDFSTSDGEADACQVAAAFIEREFGGKG